MNFQELTYQNLLGMEKENNFRNR